MCEYQCFSSLHSDHPGAVADHVTDLPKCIINKSDLLIGRRDGHNADWTDRTVNRPIQTAAAKEVKIKYQLNKTIKTRDVLSFSTILQGPHGFWLKGIFGGCSKLTIVTIFSMMMLQCEKIKLKFAGGEVNGGCIMLRSVSIL